MNLHLILFTCIHINRIIALLVSPPQQFSPSKLESEHNYDINLEYLENRTYSSPSREIGRKVAVWHKNGGVNPEELGHYFQGDILFSHNSKEIKSIVGWSRWPQAQIPYLIKGLFSK